MARRLPGVLVGGCLALLGWTMQPDLTRTAWLRAATAEAHRSAPEPRPSLAVSRLPLDFVENRGQWRGPARFVAQRGALRAGLEPDGITLQVASPAAASVRLVFENASEHVTLAGEERRPGLYNYYIGSDPSQWRPRVPAYGAVRYRNLYDGVDVRVREERERLEYDVIVTPGADLQRVVIRADGASGLRITEEGSLLLETAAGTLRQSPPVTWEVLPDGTQRPVESRFRRIDDSHYGFAADHRDPALPLVVDPGLEWSTYVGGIYSDPIGGVASARDGTGDVFVVGWPNSPDYPSLDPNVGPGVHGSVSVLRLNPSGSALLYATFIGGWHSHIVYRGLAVDAAGDAVVGGETYSPDFPTTAGAFDRTRSGNSSDGFVVRLDRFGALTFSTFLGGSNPDSVSAVAFAPDGSIIAGGGTSSFDFPTTAGAFDQTYNPPNASADGGAHGDMFVARLSADGSALTYGTYIGGPSLDVLEDLAVDALGFVNVAGWVTGNNVKVFVTTPGAFDASWNGNQDTAFARLKLDGAGSADLKYATLVGGASEDNAVAVAVDPANAELVTIAGFSWSENFPTTPGVFKTTNPPFSPLFPAEAGVVTRFRFPAAGGGSLVWSTYFGSEGFARAGEEITDVQIGSAGEVIVSGRTERENFPTTRGAYDRTHAGVSDGFVSRLSGNGAQLLYSTLFGGSADDADLFRITPLMDYVGGNTVLVAGATGSPDFPTTAGALQTAPGNPAGGVDGYVLRIAVDPDNSGDLTVDAPALLTPANGATFSRTGFLTLQWSAVSDPSGIEAYHYQVSARSDFAENFIGYHGSVQGTEVVLSPPAEVAWFWRVQAADRAGNLSAWSAPSTFAIGGGGGAPPVVSAVGTAPSSVVGGNSATGIAYLTGPAPAGGSVVRLAASRSHYPFDPSREPMPVNLPASVNVPAGATQATFVIGTVPVSSSLGVDILASIGGVGQKGSISVNPPGGITVTALEFTPITATGGGPATGKVTIGAPAPTGGLVVTLLSQHPTTARGPASVVVPAGQTSATFPITTSPVSVAVDAQFTALANGADRVAHLSVRRSLPTLTGFTLSPATVAAGSGATGTLTFSAPMPPGEWPASIDQLARVWSSDPDVASIGFSGVTVAAGATSATFSVFTVGPPTTRTATFFAAFDQVTRSAPLTVNAAPPISLSSVTFQPGTVNGGEGGIGRVNLSAGPATTVRVTLSSNNPGAITIPQSQIVSAGATSSMFSFTTAERTTAANVTVTASFGTSTASGVLTVNPSASTRIPLASITVSPLTVSGGSSSTGTATLTSAARAGGVPVVLGTSNFDVATVPFTITVPEGALAANFTITTKTVTSQTSVVISGIADNTGLSQTAGLFVTPGSAPPALTALSLSPTSVVGGSSALGTVTLTGAAPSGGAVVALSSINTAVATAPASVTVSAGATSATFAVTTSTVASSTNVTISATAGGITKTAVLTVSPGGGGGGSGNTGLRNPTANAADIGGDGNGFESSPANAHADDALNAVDNNSGSGSSTSCTSTSKDKHRFSNYGFSFPAGVSIRGIEVRLDARADSTSSSPKMCVQVSWDGGTTWTATKSTPTLGTSMGTFTLGSATDTWGRTWTTGNLSDANFRVRVINVSSSSSRDFSLDWVAVRVHFQ